MPSCGGAFRNRTWRQAEGERETAVRLERLPPGLTFPEDFPEPIAYDPARRLLVYRGFMCHKTYQALHNLSGDAAYLAALDALYLGSSYATVPPGRASRFVPWLAAATLAGVLAGMLLWLMWG